MGNHNYHVITPFSRWKNYPALKEMLRGYGIQWHLLLDDFMPDMSDEGWIHFHRFRPPPSGFFIGHWALNMFLESESVQDEDYYVLMTDDDFFQPGFFDRLRVFDSDIMVVSMNRGLDVLPAAPSHMKVCYIGMEQLVIKGKILSQYRIDGFYQADGYMILEIWRDHAGKFKFIPELQCYFNYLPPGRSGRWP